jgi:hypothetical protein
MIFTQHPEYLAFGAERDQAKVARDAWQVERTKLQRAYEIAAIDAMENGKPIPDPPSPANAGEQAYRTKMEDIKRREQAWMVDNFAEIEEAIFAREDEIVARVSAVLAEVDELAAEMAEMRGALWSLHRSTGAGTPPTAGTSFEVLLAAGRHDLRMLREPLVPNRCGFGTDSSAMSAGGGVYAR